MDPSCTRAVTAEAVRGLPAGAAFRVAVDGLSMAPTLLPGDELTACRGERASLGDLVVVDLPGTGLVVHRLLWRGRRGARTRGDGSGRMDPPLPRDAVLGRVVQATRAGRDVLPAALRRRLDWLLHFAAALRHRAGRRLLASGPAAGGSQDNPS